MLTLPGVTVGIITLLVGLGLILGLAFGGIEFFNPIQTAQDAAERQYRLEHEKQLGEIERAETQRRAQRRLEFEDRLLSIVENLAGPATGFLVMGLFLLAIGGTVFLTCSGLAKLQATAPPRRPDEPARSRRQPLQMPPRDERGDRDRPAA